MSAHKARKMLRDMTTQDEVVVFSRTATVKKLAYLTLVAEQFGFMYGDARQSGGRNNVTRLFLYRDPDPAARQRAAETAARFWQAGSGGDLPGMRPGGKLKPLPDAEPHIELLKARINFDLTGKAADRRILGGAVGLTAGLALTLVKDVLIGRALVYALISYGVLMLVLGAGFLLTRARNKKHAVRLHEAGLVAVRDESGRIRYLPPGGRLPEQVNPFAAQQVQQVQQPQQFAPGYPAPAAPQGGTAFAGAPQGHQYGGAPYPGTPYGGPGGPAPQPGTPYPGNPYPGNPYGAGPEQAPAPPPQPPQGPPPGAFGAPPPQSDPRQPGQGPQGWPGG